MVILLLGATWFRQGLQSSAGHTEGWSPRKSNRNCLNANEDQFAPKLVSNGGFAQA